MHAKQMAQQKTVRDNNGKKTLHVVSDQVVAEERPEYLMAMPVTRLTGDQLLVHGPMEGRLSTWKKF